MPPTSLTNRWTFREQCRGPGVQKRTGLPGTLDIYLPASGPLRRERGKILPPLLFGAFGGIHFVSIFLDFGFVLLLAFFVGLAGYQMVLIHLF
jgi:hypothetical protein